MTSFNQTKGEIVGSALGEALSLTADSLWIRIVEKIKSIANCGAWKSVITVKDGSVTIPAGYHSGKGTVSVDSSQAISMTVFSRVTGGANDNPIVVTATFEGCFIVFGDVLFRYDTVYSSNLTCATTGTEKAKIVYWDQHSAREVGTRGIFLYAAYLKAGQKITITLQPASGYADWSMASAVL